LVSSLSFPRKRESRNVSRKKLDARLRGHDGLNSTNIYFNDAFENGSILFNFKESEDFNRRHTGLYAED